MPALIRAALSSSRDASATGAISVEHAAKSAMIAIEAEIDDAVDRSFIAILLSD
jgi:hypothetical protein